MRILFLTSRLGHGHTGAAEAIELALRKYHRSIRTRHLDIWSLMDSSVSETVKDGYLRLVTHQPELYEQLYHLDQRTWRQLFNLGCMPEPFTELLHLHRADLFPRARRGFSIKEITLDQALFTALLSTLTAWPEWMRTKVLLRGLLFWIYRLLTGRLKKEIRHFSPDAIVATQMLPAALFSSLKERGLQMNIPAIGIVTDFGVHDFWIQPSTDHYCVATEEMAADLYVHGVASHCVHVTGIPLMPGFENPPDPVAARKWLRLDGNTPTVLVTGGWYGIGVAEVLEELVRENPNWQILVTPGYCPDVCRAVERLARQLPKRIRLYGCREEVPALMRAADVVVGKPGGLTVAEALACGRPLITSRWLGGQEGFNARFLLKHGIGGLVSPGQLLEALRTLLGCPEELAKVQVRAWQLGRRDGARRIAALVFAQS